jgi:hypothetical protein
MKKNGSKVKSTLPAGLVPFKGSQKELENLKKWWRDEPDSLASGGARVRCRQTAKK